MDIQPSSNQQPYSDDQELAKVLAGVGQQAEEAVAAAMPTPMEMPSETTAPEPQPEAAPQEDAQPVVQSMNVPPVAMPANNGDDLNSVKREALDELRPLVDKLNVSAEEKFDTYLLLIRSTDDKTLIEPAHEAAKAIADETRRAQALLDIIKEIDYLSQQQA